MTCEVLDLSSFKEALYIDSHLQQINQRAQQQLPLPKGEMLFFKNISFTPEACSLGNSAFSTGSGCAAMTGQDVQYLNSRGGNNPV